MNWISVDVSLPVYEKRVLICTRNGMVSIGKRTHTNKDGEHWETKEGAPRELTGIIGWMEIPAPMVVAP